ncbi:MAG: twin-arginine translocase TatA/TatE family subunit [Armatimonadota bacterium]|nr:twin-arginine translocase TatA/TatE family subunit [Armatimonadota bacterium]
MPHGQELIIILVIILLLFGAKKLPELGRSLGQGIKEFKKSSKGLLDEDEEEEKEKKTTESV